jgi:hypothetical protein
LQSHSRAKRCGCLRGLASPFTCSKKEDLVSGEKRGDKVFCTDRKRREKNIFISAFEDLRKTRVCGVGFRHKCGSRLGKPDNSFCDL